MNMNYLAYILIGALAILIIILLVWKNQKDRKEFERDLTRSEERPEKHDNKEDSI